MISSNVPLHMVVGARTGFLRAVKEIETQWQMLASTYNLDGKSQDFVDFGAAPMPTTNRSGMTVQDIIERGQTVTPKDWDITVFLSHNAMMDERTGELKAKVLSAGQNFNKHMNKLVFQHLNGGDGASVLGYDGKNFFNNSHVDKGAFYQTNQSNINALALSPDNFETVSVAAQNYRDDQGEFIAFAPNLLVVPPAYERIAGQITANPFIYNNANHENNPWSGRYSYIVSPYLDSTSWFLVDTNESIKPIMFVMREQPNLQSAWFDPDKPEGGYYYFKFFARYNVFWTDWRLATMGNS